MKKIVSNLLVVLMLSSFPIVGAGQFNHNSTRLNEGWMFLRSDLGGIWEAVRPSRPGNPETVPLWEAVTLPHSYNAWDAVDPDVNYYQGPAWYKTLLEVSNPFENGRTILHFEGAGQKTEVYIYTTKVGSHVGGYDEWTVDITDAVKEFLASDAGKEVRFEGKIPLSIRSDNSRDTEMIPSDLSDFNLYGGIYRYLNLVYTPALSLRNVYAKAVLDSNNKRGTIQISTEFYNKSQIQDAQVEISILDPDKKVV